MTHPDRVRDADYVLDLCDEVLGEIGLREHTFDWLLGDANARGLRRRLPVDAYYPGRQLVIEYRERQHDEPVRSLTSPSGSQSAAFIVVSSDVATTNAAIARFPRTGFSS